jgi:hypothetical protein
VYYRYGTGNDRAITGKQKEGRMTSHNRSSAQNRMGLGIAVGVGVGAALGVVMGNMGLGVGIGVAMGVVFGAAFNASGRNDEDSGPGQ